MIEIDDRFMTSIMIRLVRARDCVRRDDTEALAIEDLRIIKDDVNGKINELIKDINEKNKRSNKRYK